MLDSKLGMRVFTIGDGWKMIGSIRMGIITLIMMDIDSADVCKPRFPDVWSESYVPISPRRATINNGDLGIWHLICRQQQQSIPKRFRIDTWLWLDVLAAKGNLMTMSMYIMKENAPALSKELHYTVILQSKTAIACASPRLCHSFVGGRMDPPLDRRCLFDRPMTFWVFKALLSYTGMWWCMLYLICSTWHLWIAGCLDAVLWNQTSTMQMARMHKPAVCAAIRSPGASKDMNPDSYTTWQIHTDTVFYCDMMYCASCI